MKEKAKKKSVKEKPLKVETQTPPKPDPVPQYINVSFEPGRMVFEVGCRKFYMDAEMANFLFGREVGLEFEKLSDRMTEDFTEFETEDFFARFMAINNHYRSVSITAKTLRVNEDKLRKWLNRESGKTWRNQRLFNIQELIRKYADEYFPSQSPGEKKPIKLDLKKIADMLDKKMHLNDIASALGYKHRWAEFIEAYTSQRKEIEKILSQRRTKEQREAFNRTFGL